MKLKLIFVSNKEVFLFSDPDWRGLERGHVRWYSVTGGSQVQLYKVHCPKKVTCNFTLSQDGHRYLYTRGS
jgi:hypothetical protein